MQALMKRHRAADLEELRSAIHKVWETRKQVISAFHEMFPGHDEQFSAVIDPHRREVIDRWLDLLEESEAEVEKVEADPN